MKKKPKLAAVREAIKTSMEMGAQTFLYLVKKDPQSVRAAALLVCDNDNRGAAEILTKAFKMRKESADTLVTFLHCAHIISKCIPYNYFQEVIDAGRTIH